MEDLQYSKKLSTLILKKDLDQEAVRESRFQYLAQVVSGSVVVYEQLSTLSMVTVATALTSAPL